jgi:hypothetical protein
VQIGDAQDTIAYALSCLASNYRGEAKSGIWELVEQAPATEDFATYRGQVERAQQLILDERASPFPDTAAALYDAYKELLRIARQPPKESREAALLRELIADVEAEQAAAAARPIERIEIPPQPAVSGEFLRGLGGAIAVILLFAGFLYHAALEGLDARGDDAMATVTPRPPTDAELAEVRAAEMAGCANGLSHDRCTELFNALDCYEKPEACPEVGERLMEAAEADRDYDGG